MGMASSKQVNQTLLCYRAPVPRSASASTHSIVSMRKPAPAVGIGALLVGHHRADVGQAVAAQG